MGVEAELIIYQGFGPGITRPKERLAEPAIGTGVTAMTAAVLELMGR